MTSPWFLRRTPMRRSRTGGHRLFTTAPTSVLVRDASKLVAERRWREATQILKVAAATAVDESDQRSALEHLAVTSADGGRHNLSSDAVFNLQEMWPRTPTTWVAFANVALARRNYVHADAAARSALSLDPHNHGAWAAMTAAYAGLGWFDEAQDCLGRIDTAKLSDLERWRIGRAVNRWAVRNTAGRLMAAASVLVLGALAFVVAAVVPFATRSWRLRRLPHLPGGISLSTMATEAWRFERRLQLTHLVVALMAVLVFAATL